MHVLHLHVCGIPSYPVNRVLRYHPYRISSSYDSVSDKLRNQLFMKSLLHPVRYAYTLIQLGFEPIPPSMGHTIMSFMGLSYPMLMYPWLGSYMWQLVSQKIISIPTLCTHGLFAALMKNVLSHTNQRAVTEFLFRDQDEYALTAQRQEEDLSLEEALIAIPSNADFTKKIIQYLCFKIYENILTQPFHVIMARQIAASIEHDASYLYFHRAVITIYHEHGWTGFFQGLVPRIVGECAFCGLFLIFSRIFHQYILDSKKTSRSSVPFVWSLVLRYLLSHLTSPFRTVATVMAVNNSKLKLATSFSNWQQCWRHLNTTDNQLYRGNTYFWRSEIQAQHRVAPLSVASKK